MRAAAEGRTELTPTLARHLDLCLGCRACETACPSGVPFGQLLEATRGQLARQGVRAPDTDHRALSFALSLFPHPARLAPMLGALRFYQRSGLQGVVRSLGALGPFERLRSMEALLPMVPDRMAPLPEVTPHAAQRRGRVGILTGCVQRFLYPDVNAATVRLLAAAGWEVVAPRGQGCCGALHLHAGRLEEFRGLARELIAGLRPRARPDRGQCRGLRLRAQGIRSLAARRRSGGLRPQGARRLGGAHRQRPAARATCR